MNTFDDILVDLPGRIVFGHNSGTGFIWTPNPDVVHRQIGDIPGIITPPKDPTWHRPSRAEEYCNAIKAYLAGKMTYPVLYNTMKDTSRGWSRS